jgi:hypothetical protein
MANKIMSIYETVADAQATYLTDAGSSASIEWFQDEIERLISPMPKHRDIVGQPEHFSRGKPWVGSMSMFVYDAATKNSLPYWDRFPLVIPVEIYKEPKPSFAGINLHYLDHSFRALLLDRLMVYGSPDTHRLNRLDYEILSGIKKLKMYKPCWHRYSMDRIRTRVAMVPKPLWTTAVMLPTESFMKVRNPSIIWRDSIKEFRTGK